jgi:hypothetical protein
MVEYADVAICVPIENTQHIQEAHIAIEHIICHLVEREVFGRGWRQKVDGQVNKLTLRMGKLPRHDEEGPRPATTTTSGDHKRHEIKNTRNKPLRRFRVFRGSSLS